MPGPYDNGLQRTCWLGHMVTDWMGDAGFVKTLSIRAKVPNVFGDTTFITGSVVGTEPLSDLEGVIEKLIQGRNQLNQLSTTGGARAILPRRGNNSAAVSGSDP